METLRHCRGWHQAAATAPQDCGCEVKRIVKTCCYLANKTGRREDLTDLLLRRRCLVESFPGCWEGRRAGAVTGGAELREESGGSLLREDCFQLLVSNIFLLKPRSTFHYIAFFGDLFLLQYIQNCSQPLHRPKNTLSTSQIFIFSCSERFRLQSEPFSMNYN